jgi:endonuclease-8
MPEGDTLHRLALKLAPLVGQRIERLTLSRKSVRPDAYTGRAVTGIEAIGKNLLMHFEGGVTLRSHLKMHGTWRLAAASEPDPSGADVVVILRTPMHLAVCRSAPVAELVRTRDLSQRRDAQVRGGLGDLGPDVLGSDFDPIDAAVRWHASVHPTIAEALLDQRLVAGIGNEWKSELCFVVKVSPFTAPGAVALPVLTQLAKEAQERMRRNVVGRPRLYPIDRARAVSRIARFERKPGEGPLSVYGRDGQPCYDCHTTIERRVQPGPTPRSTYWCPRCQP